MLELIPDITGIVLGIGMLALMFRIGSMLGKMSGKLEIVCTAVNEHEKRIQVVEGVVRYGRKRSDTSRDLEEGS